MDLVDDVIRIFRNIRVFFPLIGPHNNLPQLWSSSLPKYTIRPGSSVHSTVQMMKQYCCLLRPPVKTPLMPLYKSASLAGVVKLQHYLPSRMSYLLPGLDDDLPLASKLLPVLHFFFLFFLPTLICASFLFQVFQILHASFWT